MPRSIELLKKRYLTNIKENPELLIGIELEFPIVHQEGQATDIELCQSLLERLVPLLDMEVEKRDRDGRAIQLVSQASGDRILFEVAYSTLEFAFAPAKTIFEVAQRFQHYLEIIQGLLAQGHHEIQGYGVHPQWAQNSNQPVNAPRYQMLMQYLSLSEKSDKPLHAYPQYGAFICGSQVQLDVSKDNYLRVINAFNQIEVAKAYLLANSELWGEEWPTRIARDIFWEESMHGIYRENVGVNPRDFQSEDDFFAYLNRSAIFTAERQGVTYYFPPIQVKDYLVTPEIEAYSIDGERVYIQPEEKDFQTHRSYQYQDLTTRGTVEFRSSCTQPLERTFSVAAFHLGLFVNLDLLEDLLASAPFFDKYGRDYKKLRRDFSAKDLNEQERADTAAFSQDLLELAYQGLVQRKKGEEIFLDPLLES